MNTVSFISIPGSIAPDQEILVFGDHRLNYAALNELVGRLSSAFKTLGLKPRDVVAALDTNSDNYIAGYYAAAKAGLTWLPLNYRAKDAELEYMINTAGAKVLLAGDRYLDLVGRVGPKLKTAKAVAWGEGKAGMPRLADLVKAADVDEGEVEVEDEDVSVLMYTSGTTSLPKGVMLRFRDFAAYVTANVEMADGTERGVALVCVPFYHIAGTTAMMTNLWTGRRMVIMPQFDPKTWLQLVAREKVTHAFVVPTMMKQLLDEPSFADTDFSHLTNLAYGGAAMPIQTIRRAIEAFPKTVGFVNAYGQTETTSSLTVLGPDDHRIDGDPKTVELKLKRLNSIGQPLARRRNRRPRRRRRAVGGGTGRRNPHPHPAHHEGLRRARGRLPSARGMARDRRPRMGRRRGLRVLRRTQGRHDHPRRRKYRASRNRGRPDEPSGDRRGGRNRRAVGRMGTDRQGFRRQTAGSERNRGRHRRSFAARAWRASNVPSRSSSSRRCRRTRSAKFCARSCVTRAIRQGPNARVRRAPRRAGSKWLAPADA